MKQLLNGLPRKPIVASIPWSHWCNWDI